MNSFSAISPADTARHSAISAAPASSSAQFAAATRSGHGPYMHAFISRRECCVPRRMPSTLT